MGAYTCEFGNVHKMCRCPQKHTMKCDRPYEHCLEAEMKHPAPEHKCIMLTKGMVGKHALHPAHEWWYTSYGGGHQLDAYDPDEKNIRRFNCPGRD